MRSTRAPAYAVLSLLLLPLQIFAAPATQGVTLHLKDASPQSAFRDLGRQAGCVFVVNPADIWAQSLPALTLDIDAEPFWSAAKQLCAKSGLYPFYLERRRITLIQSGKGWMDGPTLVSSGFLVLASQATRINTVRFGRPEQLHHELTVTLSFLPDPSLRVLRGNRVPRIEQAADESGQALPTALPSGDGLSQGGPFAWNLEVKFPAAAAAKRISRLKGSARFSVATSFDKWEVPDILAAANVSRTVGKGTLTIMQATKLGNRAPETYDVRISVSPARGRHPSPILHRPAG